MQLLIKGEIMKNRDFSCYKTHRCCVFIMLINVKMPTIADILTFMSRINFLFILDNHGKSFITSGSKLFAKIIKMSFRNTNMVSNSMVLD